MPDINIKSFILIYFIGQRYSQGLMLPQPMQNAGMDVTGSQLGASILLQLGSTVMTTGVANQMAPSGQPGVSYVTHIPTVCNYLQASKSKEDLAVRGFLVFMVYGSAGILNFISVEAGSSVAPGMALFAQFMVANSCLIILPAHWPFKKKLVVATFVSGGLVRIIKKLPIDRVPGVRKFKKRLELKVSKTKNLSKIKKCLIIRKFKSLKKFSPRSVGKAYLQLISKAWNLGWKLGSTLGEKSEKTLSKFKIRNANYIKIVFVGLGIEDLILA